MNQNAPAVKRLRRSLGLVIVGLTVQLLCTLYWSPASFIIFAVVGVGFVLLGAGWFLLSAWRRIDDQLAHTLDTPTPEEPA